MQSGSNVPGATVPVMRLDLRSQTGDAVERLPSDRAHATDHDPTLPPPLLLYFRSTNRQSLAYVRVLERLFGARRAGRGAVLFSRAPVLFLKVEEAFFRYALICLLRSLAGRRTAGLLLESVHLVHARRLRDRWKAGILRCLKRLDAVHTLAALPFSVVPGAATVAKSWIYDCRLWDLTDEERAAVAGLRRDQCQDARLVLTAPGCQNRRKGFDLFAAIYSRSIDLRARFQFISCGTVSPAMTGHAATLRAAGGVVVDRAISDAELLGTYAASDAVWCLYRPVDDHASCVLGRAAQLGIPVVVRYGSPAHRLCIVENIRHIPATVETVVDRLASPLPPCDEGRGRLMALRFARQSEETLRAAVGLREG